MRSLRILPAVATFVTLVGLSAAAAPGTALADDMLKPDEIQTTGVSSNPSNDSGAFLGGGLSFGQSRTTEEGASPGLGYLLKIEPGYQLNSGSWNRLEFSGELVFGSYGYRLKDEDGGKISMPVGFGLLLKIGHGYSLGNKMMGVTKVGVGPMSAKFKGSVDNTDFESDAVSGLAAMVGWTLVLPMTDSLDGTAGFSLTHAQFDVGKVKFDGGGSADLDRTVIVNTLAAEAGLRLRF